MTYEGLMDVVDRAWSEMVTRITSETGCDTADLLRSLDCKDCFNGVFDAVIDVVDVECEL